jgi:hypothetical protein
MKDWKESKSYTLTPKEIEELLATDFGGKLQPVDDELVAKQRQQRERNKK